MLGDLELEQVQLVETDEDQVVVRHRVPALEGDFLQDLGRRGARLDLTGVLTAPDTKESLAELRTRFHAGDPVSFVSDITSATGVDQVLVERMDVRELAGRPTAFEYALTLRELTEAEPVDTEDIVIPPPPPPTVTDGKLAVTVVVEGDPAFDMDRVRLTVRGTEEKSGAPLDRVLTTRTRPDTWFEDPFPAGQYTAEALVDDFQTPTGQHEVLTGSSPVRVVEGATASTTIVLRRGAKIGTVFLITFHFDKAFVEPCMRHVLRDVIAFSDAHPDERLLIVGHTDRTGGDDYNQALSERRARATFAMMTFGSEPDRAVAEWDELRRTRPTGTITTVKDTWGTREIQHMLQDLGRFTGNVGGDAALTDAAIRRFQSDHGLTPDGVVGDGTWPVLIREYLAHDALSLPVERLMPNADGAGCDNGPMRWVGCGEQDPVDNRQTAWRPNRRTELMFVKESVMPAKVPKPITLDQVPEGAGGGGWCLDDGTATAVDDFVVPWGTACPSPPQPRWCRTPAEPGTFPVTGRIRFSDGTPFANRPYVLTAADGEYLNGEVPTTGAAAHAGTPIPGRTDADGNWTFPPPGTPPQKGRGIFTIAVEGPFVVRTESQTLADVRGNATCFRRDDDTPTGIVVVDRAVASVVPSITGPDVVVVKKPHTNPARRPVTLATSTPFTGSGRLDRSSDRVRLFDAVAGGAELAFDGVDNVFTAARLAAGVTLFAEGRAPSAALADVTLTLVLTVGGSPGLSATHAMTAVELLLELHASRTAAGVDPAALSEAEKITPGRFIQVQDAGNHAGRAMVTVRQATPAAFTGTLVLERLDARTRLFAAADEIAGAGQAVLATPLQLPNAAIPAAGTRFWVEGAGVSGGLRDTVLQLGIDTVEPDGDRVQLTVVELSALTMTIPATRARTERLGNFPVAPHVVASPAVPVPADFDESPNANPAVPLWEGSVLPATPIQMTVAVRPAGVPIRWTANRAVGLSVVEGGDDAQGIVDLVPGRAAPTIDPVAGTLLADHVGTFHVRAYVDGNGNGTYEHRIDREPSIVRNVVLGRATLALDSSAARSDRFRDAPFGAGGISVSSGDFTIGVPDRDAMRMEAQVDVVTGGLQGRRSIAQFFGGWTNNLVDSSSFTLTFTDPTTVPPTAHVMPVVFASNAPADGVFRPAGAAPALVLPPILDTGRQPVRGRGGISSTLTESRIRPPRTDRPLGQRWIVEAVDSPGINFGAGAHPVVAAAQLTQLLIRIRFDATLTLWTNDTADPGPSDHPASRLYGALIRVNWSLDGRWTINPATGAVAVATAPTSVITARAPSSPAIAATTSGVEVRFPAGLDLIGTDART
jgi:outer membrane protein OmpA-like peptidoglycan-associated protein